MRICVKWKLLAMLVHNSFSTFAKVKLHDIYVHILMPIHALFDND